MGNFPGDNHHFHGALDELRVYNRALSESEIHQLSGGSLQFSATSYSVNENGGIATITVTRHGSFGNVSVEYTTSDETATAGSDYTATSGTLSWANGDKEDKTFTIDIVDDDMAEGNETVLVQLKNPIGVSLRTPNSVVLTIVEAPPSIQPTLISPEEGATFTKTQQPTFQWNALPSAESYLLQVNDFEMTTQHLYQWYSAKKAGCAEGTGTCTVTPDTPLNPGLVVWWIRAANQHGEGPWSDPKHFVIQSETLPGRPTLVSPNGTISNNLKVNYTWKVVLSATWYQLWINNASNQYVFNKWYKAETTNCSAGAGTCKIKPTEFIPNQSEKYIWWARAWNQAGSGQWSDGMFFSAGPPASSTLLTPNGNLSENLPTYQWEAVFSATWYYLWVLNNDTKKVVHNKWYKSDALGCGDQICEITPTVTLAKGKHTWWVQTWNEAGHGPWSEGMVFTTTTGSEPALPPEATTLVSPKGTISQTTPTYIWNVVENATWYHLWINNASGQARFKKWFQADDVCGADTCQITPAVSLAKEKHTWWVQTWNEAGNGEWSDGMAFTID